MVTAPHSTSYVYVCLLQSKEKKKWEPPPPPPRVGKKAAESRDRCAVAACSQVIAVHDA